MDRRLKKPLSCSLLACVCLEILLTSGCGQTQSTVTPAEQAQFGKYGQPMPDAAKKYMQEHAAQAQPPSNADLSKPK